jgi:hypothetical protein
MPGVLFGLGGRVVEIEVRNLVALAAFGFGAPVVLQVRRILLVVLAVLLVRSGQPGLTSNEHNRKMTLLLRSSIRV